MKTVYNTLFGQLWDEQTETVDEDEMLERREEYDADLPERSAVPDLRGRYTGQQIGIRGCRIWPRPRHGESKKGIYHGKPLEDDVWGAPGWHYRPDVEVQEREKD